MKNRKIFQGGLLLVLLVLSFSLTACLKQEPKVDVLAEDNKYHYRNDTLGFQINFPEEFQYYQAQRIETENFTDLEFLVPTGDINYPSEVVGLANPVTVKLFNQDYWQDVNQDLYIKVAEKGDKIYALEFWTNYPSDWVNKWNDQMKQEIVDSFKLR